MDIVNALGNTADNILAGRTRVVDVDQFARWWEKRDNGETLFLDCREWGNAGPFVEKYPEHWRNIPQGELRERLAEVPRDTATRASRARSNWSLYSTPASTFSQPLPPGSKRHTVLYWVSVVRA